MPEGLQPRAGLSVTELDAVADLERRVVAADGGRLKLEWAALWGRTGRRVEDLLWWDGDVLAGFLGLYDFGGGDVELAGMVAPDRRRRGIATALLDAALGLLADRAAEDADDRTSRGVLLVCPRTTGAGAAFATARGGVLDHCEHAMLLRGEPAEGPCDEAVSLRKVDPTDEAEVAAVARLLEVGFGHAPDGLAAQLADDRADVLVVVRGGEVVGHVRSTLDGVTGGVYGFVVDPRCQGQGIGRDVLRRVCRQLRQRGAQQVGLEVEVTNERALGLYTSLGFQRVTTEDYYRLPAASR